jgi:hypothetical protein
VFSSEEEAALFQRSVPAELQHPRWQSIVVAPNNEEGIITKKKLGALGILSQHYTYLAVFDCEVLFVKPMDTDTIYKEIVDSKLFKSNRRHNSTHLREVAKRMGYENNEVLVAQTEGFTQYWWFNEICVYEQTLFQEFYAWLIAHPNSHEILNDFACFDYLLYSMWLICNKGYRVKKHLSHISFAGAAIETNYNSNDISHTFQSYQDRNINHQEIDHIKVQIMVDRDWEHCQKEGQRLYL